MVRDAAGGVCIRQRRCLNRRRWRGEGRSVSPGGELKKKGRPGDHLRCAGRPWRQQGRPAAPQWNMAEGPCKKRAQTADRRGTGPGSGKARGDGRTLRPLGRAQGPGQQRRGRRRHRPAWRLERTQALEWRATRWWPAGEAAGSFSPRAPEWETSWVPV